MPLEVVNVIATLQWRGPSFDDLRAALRRAGVLEENRAPWWSTRMPPNGHYVAFYKGGKMLTTGARA